MPSARQRKVFAFIVILLIPIIFFTYFEIKKQRTGIRLKKLPFLSKTTLPDFSFTTHTGGNITRDSVKNKILISDFFFTSCRGICPTLTREMLRVQDFIIHHPNLKSQYRIISHTVDPETDDVVKLHKYAQAYGVDSTLWVLVTGDKKEIYDLAIDFYKLPAIQMMKDTLEPFVHSNRFVLVDKEGYIRGYYDGTDSNSVKQMMKDIVILDIDYEISKKKKQ